MAACVPESAFTPTTTSGGANDACVTQFTVAAAMLPSLPCAVSTYNPYGIMRKAVFFALGSMPPPCALPKAHLHRRRNAGCAIRDDSELASVQQAIGDRHGGSAETPN